MIGYSVKNEVFTEIIFSERMFAGLNGKIPSTTRIKNKDLAESYTDKEKEEIALIGLHVCQISGTL